MRAADRGSLTRSLLRLGDQPSLLVQCVSASIPFNTAAKSATVDFFDLNSTTFIFIRFVLTSRLFSTRQSSASSNLSRSFSLALHCMYHSFVIDPFRTPSICSLANLIRILFSLIRQHSYRLHDHERIDRSR